MANKDNIGKSDMSQGEFDLIDDQAPVVLNSEGKLAWTEIELDSLPAEQSKDIETWIATEHDQWARATRIKNFLNASADKIAAAHYGHLGPVHAKSSVNARYGGTASVGFVKGKRPVKEVKKAKAKKAKIRL